MDASVISAESVGFLVAAILTLVVFSYLLRDNVLYRAAEHLFVGAVVGYVVVVAFHQVFMAKLLMPMVDALSTGKPDGLARAGLLLIPLILGLLLLFKSSRRAGPLSWLGSLSIAFLLGVGAALAIGGGLLGTLFPQIDATADINRYVERYGPALGLFSGLVALAGTVGVLLHFYFSSSREGRLAGFRNGVVRTWGGLGWWFILIAFGAILATTFMSRLSLLAGRIQFLIDGVRNGPWAGGG
jgi:hypothetical protein